MAKNKILVFLILVFYLTNHLQNLIFASIFSKNQYQNYYEIDNTIYYQIKPHYLVEIVFYPKKVQVTDCYQLNKKERYEISSFINYYLTKERVFLNRSVNNLRSELTFHAIAYQLKIHEKQAIHADLEYAGDQRWYIRIICKLFEIFGL